MVGRVTRTARQRYAQRQGDSIALLMVHTTVRRRIPRREPLRGEGVRAVPTPPAHRSRWWRCCKRARGDFIQRCRLENVPVGRPRKRDLGPIYYVVCTFSLADISERQLKLGAARRRDVPWLRHAQRCRVISLRMASKVIGRLESTAGRSARASKSRVYLEAWQRPPNPTTTSSPSSFREACTASPISMIRSCSETRGGSWASPTSCSPLSCCTWPRSKRAACIASACAPASTPTAFTSCDSPKTRPRG